jgi:hypothetical protein
LMLAPSDDLICRIIAAMKIQHWRGRLIARPGYGSFIDASAYHVSQRTPGCRSARCGEAPD